jgi:hypothetical protein
LKEGFGYQSGGIGRLRNNLEEMDQRVKNQDGGIAWRCRRVGRWLGQARRIRVTKMIRYSGRVILVRQRLRLGMAMGTRHPFTHG